MANTAGVEIPNRALFKPAEVCDIVKVQPYVLRTWEAEFPELGVAKTAGGPRVYRRSDVEQVAKIKHLLLVEGLTLAGARRKLEDDVSPVAAESAGAGRVDGPSCTRAAHGNQARAALDPRFARRASGSGGVSAYRARLNGAHEDDVARQSAGSAW